MPPLHGSWPTDDDVEPGMALQSSCSIDIVNMDRIGVFALCCSWLPLESIKMGIYRLGCPCRGATGWMDGGGWLIVLQTRHGLCVWWQTIEEQQKPPREGEMIFNHEDISNCQSIVEENWIYFWGVGGMEKGAGPPPSCTLSPYQLCRFVYPQWFIAPNPHYNLFVYSISSIYPYQFDLNIVIQWI